MMLKLRQSMESGLAVVTIQMVEVYMLNENTMLPVNFMMPQLQQAILSEDSRLVASCSTVQYNITPGRQINAFCTSLRPETST
jgi:hypothetical protein